MVAQDGGGAADGKAPRRARGLAVLGAVLTVYGLLTLTMLWEMSLTRDAALSLAGVVTWAAAILVVEGRWGQAHLGILDYGTLFDGATGALVQAGMQGVSVLSPASAGVTFGLSILACLPCYALVVISKRVLFTDAERRLLRAARSGR